MDDHEWPSWVGPSGRKYHYRSLNPFEMAYAWEGIPLLGQPKQESADGSAEVDMAQIRRVWMRMIIPGTKSPRIVEIADPNNPDAMTFDDLGADMSGLRDRIQEATLPYIEVAAASSFRGDGVELRPPSLDGGIVQPDPVGADESKPNGVDLQPDGLVSGQGLGGGAIQEV